MPEIIRNIDEIAREKQRDVIFVQFHNFTTGLISDYRKNPVRKIIIKWLDDNGIGNCECGGFDSGGVIDGYSGEIYIDVALDEDDDNFIKLAGWFLKDGGGQRFDNAWIFYLPLAVALLNTGDQSN